MKSPRKLLLPTAIALLLLAGFLVLRGLRESSPPANADQPPPVDTAVQTRPSSAASSEQPASTEADRLIQAEGATTDVTLSTFPVREYRRSEPPAGKPAGAPAGLAYLHVPSSRTRVVLEPNQLGEFPPVEARPNETVGARILLPDASPGSPVRVAILDGGSFPSLTGPARLIEVADWRGIAFEFTTSGNMGSHRLLVQAAGHPARVLDIHVHDATEGWPPSAAAPTE
jgi:hypothetical protein